MADEPSDLTDAIGKSIDRWREKHPDVMVSEVLAALEKVRHTLTEALVNPRQPRPLQGSD